MRKGDAEGAQKPPEESRPGLVGRPKGRPRPERVLKDADAPPPSFRTDPSRGRASARAITRRNLNDLFRRRALTALAAARAGATAGVLPRLHRRSELGDLVERSEERRVGKEC